MLMTRAPWLIAHSMPLRMLKDVLSAEPDVSLKARTARIFAPGATPSSRSRDTMAPAIAVPCECAFDSESVASNRCEIVPASSACSRSTSESITATMMLLPDATRCASLRCSLPIMYCAGSPRLAVNGAIAAGTCCTSE